MRNWFSVFNTTGSCTPEMTKSFGAVSKNPNENNVKRETHRYQTTSKLWVKPDGTFGVLPNEYRGKKK